MKCLLLAAWMAMTGNLSSRLPVIVPDAMVEWCRDITPVQVDNERTYSRQISIEKIPYTITYEDRGRKGRTVEDTLMIERQGAMFFDEGLDGVLDSGEVNGVFYARGVPSPYLQGRQEEYSLLVEAIIKKLQQKDGKKDDHCQDSYQDVENIPEVKDLGEVPAEDIEHSPAPEGE